MLIRQFTRLPRNIYHNKPASHYVIIPHKSARYRWARWRKRAGIAHFRAAYCLRLKTSFRVNWRSQIDDLFTLRWLRTKEGTGPSSSFYSGLQTPKCIHDSKDAWSEVVVSWQISFVSGICWLPTRLPCSPSRTSTSHHLCHRLRCLVSAHQCIHIKSFPPEFQQGYELPNLTDTHSNSSFRLVRGTESWCRRRTGQRYGNFKLHPSNSTQHTSGHSAHFGNSLTGDEIGHLPEWYGYAHA